MTKRLLSVLFAAFSLMIALSTGHATATDGTVGNRVVILDDPAVDYALRLKLIRAARTSIDMIMYHQEADAQVGTPLLEALRDAARRGVKIRMIRSFFASFHSDRGGLAPLLLNDDSLLVRPEVITYGRWLTTPIPGPNARMWNTFDEKFLVVDGKHVVTGGRGQGESYLNWKDADLYLQGPIVQGFTTIFESCWKTAQADFGHTRGDPLTPAASRRSRWRHRVPPAPALLEARLDDATALQASDGYRPDSVNLYYHPLIRILHESPRVDFERMPDAILDRFIELTEKSQRILFYSLYPAQDSRLTLALIAAAKRGARIELITNSLESARNLDRNVWPYDAGIPSQVRLARAGVRIHQWVPSDRFRFLHQKMAIFDQNVLHGSHNFNWSSTHSYDELEIDLRDRALADEFAARFYREAQEHTRLATLPFLEDQERRCATGILMSDWFLGFY